MEQLITRNEASRILSKPVSWLRWAERNRVIPFFKVGQQIRYRPSDILEWLEARRVAATADSRLRRPPSSRRSVRPPCRGASRRSASEP